MVVKHFEVSPNDYGCLKFEICYFDVTSNLDFDFGKATDFPDGFLNFKFRIEITFLKDVEILDCIQFVSSVLLFFWNKNIPAVASCDYEFHLPELGGYNSKNIPWVDPL